MSGPAGAARGLVHVVLAEPPMPHATSHGSRGSRPMATVTVQSNARVVGRSRHFASA